jgi:3-oxoacyl-[acyl-carrier protein] reductase
MPAQKSAIVTGAGSGIGRAVAVRLSLEGFRVAIATRNPGEAEATARTIRDGGGSAMAVATDVSNPGEVEHLVNLVMMSWNSIDILVNNAGINLPQPIDSIDFSSWESVLAVNLTGAFLLTRAVLPHMLAAGSGAIVNISSPHALRCGTGVAAYTTSKAALLGLTRATAIDYGRHGIRVNAVLPGTIDTPLVWNHIPVSDRARRRAVFEEVHPIGRIGQPADIAKVVAFLADGDADFILGAAIPVDGGLLATLL